MTASDALRIQREKRTISAMMRIYCKAHHGTASGLCEDCSQLQDYAHRRLDVCPFGEEKPACNQCKVHCYSKTMRERITAVMRYAGPRMLLHHPILAIHHLLDERRPAPELTRKHKTPPDA